MSVKHDRRQVPNWIAENDFTPASRLHWIKTIMNCSPQDWSKHTGKVEVGADRPEEWAIYLLANYDNREACLDIWLKTFGDC